MINTEQFEYFAPGRVNLIGEHIDYNGGRVLPFAIDKGTYLSAKFNNTGFHKFSTEDFQPNEVKVKEGDLSYLTDALWPNYVLGVIAEFEKRGFHLPACDFHFAGNLPSAAGLSSSASVELVTAFAINDLLNAGLSRLELVKIGKACENLFVKVNCGIMDQFAVGFGKKNSVIMLDCNTCNYEYADFILNDYTVVVINTNKPRNLIKSPYNERFNQCLTLKDIIGKVRKVDFLCELSSDEISEYKSLINDDVLYRRLYHLVTEDERVIQTVDALKNNNLQRVGELLLQSHLSLRNDYEVTGPELDAIVDAAMQLDSVIGARMTGAGFGGCAIAIVKKDAVDVFEKYVAEKYTAKTGLKPSFYVVAPEDGVRKNIL